ncbi:hypothetical protein D0S45_15275 [Marinifilum sp. JC120]|nr:hypothetical protein D0S45_15275 [Marinifilum sp. JC120]
MLFDTAFKYLGEIIVRIFSATGGSFATHWFKEKGFRKKHDKEMFDLIDSILPEDVVKKVVEDAKSSYNIFYNDSHGITGLDLHWEKESSKFHDKKLNELANGVSESGMALLKYFVGEGMTALFEKYDGKFYTVYFKEYKNEPINHSEESQRLQN